MICLQINIIINGYHLWPENLEKKIQMTNKLWKLCLLKKESITIHNTTIFLAYQNAKDSKEIIVYLKMRE